MEVYAGNDFQLDFSTVCVLATVNNIFSGCGSCFRVQRVSQQSLDDICNQTLQGGDKTV